MEKIRAVLVFAAAGGSAMATDVRCKMNGNGSLQLTMQRPIAVLYVEVLMRFYESGGMGAANLYVFSAAAVAGTAAT